MINLFQRQKCSNTLANAVNFKDAINIGAKNKFKEQKIDKEDIAFLQYTGGTTGGVKAAILSHRNVLANAIQVREWLGENLKFGEAVKYLAQLAGMQPYMFSKQDEEREKSGMSIKPFLVNMLTFIIMSF